MALFLQHRNAGIGRRKRFFLTCCLVPAFSLLHCGGRAQIAGETDRTIASPDAHCAAYTIQVGAYSNPDRAARAAGRLRLFGLDAYIISPKNRLHKVRFGKFPSRDLAKEEATVLAAKGLFHEYLVVKTHHSPASSSRRRGSSVRDNIVETTKQFIGLPYAWGRSSPKDGFDCSGLTMAVYQLNGLNLPRSSVAQWEIGIPVKRNEIRRGDLVFFTISRKGVISHVGIYLGGGNFAHAPGKGKEIRIDSLSNGYFKSKYAGARTYL